MPGLVVVAGAAGAEERAREGARPLLRQAWERLSLACAPDGQVALAFAGERGGVASDEPSGCLAALDGELFGPPRSGSETAAELLRLYLRDGERLDPPDGCFNAAVWDPGTQTLLLLTDRFARRPLYVAHEDGTTVAAGELKGLVAAGVRPRLDLDFWAEALAYEYAVSQRSPLTGVRSLPFATTLVVADGAAHERTRWTYRLEPAPAASEAALVDEFGLVLEQSIARRTDGPAAFALSGGLDSRCLATVVEAHALPVLAATYGAPGSADLELGTEVARRAGLPHRRLAHEPGYVARGAYDVVWLGEGRIRCFHANQTALRPLRTEHGLSTLLVGFLGDDVVRTALRIAAGPGEARFVRTVHEHLARSVHGHLVGELFRPAFAAELAGRAEAGLAESLGREEGDRQCRYKQVTARYAQSPSSLFDDHLFPRDPFTDPHVVEFGRRLPSRARERGRLQRAYLRRFPHLADLASPKQGLAPAAHGWREGLAVQSGRVRSRARRATESLLGSARRPSPGDYAADLRATGAELLSVLLEERTLARGQLGPEAVGRLVSDTLAGRARHAYELGMLLTLELFQRLFVDGDGFAREPGPSGTERRRRTLSTVSSAR